jgi:GNAT superfamily N-acetyltransferase
MPDRDIVIRDADTGDLDALLALYAALADGRTPPSPADAETSRPVLDAIMRDPRRHLMVAVVDGAVIGTADVLIVPNLTHHARPWAVVENVVVSPSARRAGAGRALMTEIIDLVRAAGCYKLQLHSGKQRTEAHRFYEALGFRPVAEGFKLYFDATGSH